MQKLHAPAGKEVKLPSHLLWWKSLRILRVWAVTCAEVQECLSGNNVGDIDLAKADGLHPETVGDIWKRS